MVHRRPVFTAVIALLLVLGGAFTVLSGGEAHAATSLCQEQALLARTRRSTRAATGATAAPAASALIRSRCRT
jgi:hypothetical protein